MRDVLRFSAIAVMFVGLGSRSDADDSSLLTAKLGAAAASVTSFVIHMQVKGTTGVSGTMTFVRPLRMKSEFTMGQLTLESYLVDGSIYVHSQIAGWQKAKIDPAHAPQQSLSIAEGLAAARVRALPDRQENGTTVGVVQVAAQLPAAYGPMAQQATQELTCSYDKTTFRLGTCSNNVLTMTYTNYNDPSNVVTLPAEAEAATPIVLPSPAAAPASAAPLPAPTASPASRLL